MTKINLKNITTEQRNKNSINIDQKSTREILKIINQEDEKIAKAIGEKLDDIASTVDKIYEKVKAGGRVIYVGAGTSGRLGVLDASEMLPTFGESDIFIGLIAGGDFALRHPIEGAEDNMDAAIKDLKNIQFSKKDVLVAIGASGRTPYCLEALNYANSLEALSVAVCMTNESAFSKVAKNTIAVVPGPEVVTGSTRMKAGTATKMVLNMISTAIMIKLGKVYDNLMVDLKATNEKLVARCIGIVKEITDIDDEEKILKILQAANFDCKVAIVALRQNVSVKIAKEILEKNSNQLRGALTLI